MTELEFVFHEKASINILEMHEKASLNVPNMHEKADINLEYIGIGIKYAKSDENIIIRSKKNTHKTLFCQSKNNFP